MAFFNVPFICFFVTVANHLAKKKTPGIFPAYETAINGEAVRHVQSIRSIVLVANVSHQDWDEKQNFSLKGSELDHTWGQV